MNYRHAYHAGNFADVLKHAVLALILRHLNKKPGAWRLLDTHAGIGAYELAADAPSRTGEWRSGIGRIAPCLGLGGIEKLEPSQSPSAAALNALMPFGAALHSVNPDGVLRVYPGSPAIARALARRQDRLMLTELHPGDAQSLAERFAGDQQVKVRALDGWLAFGAFVPPKERRGLVLVDPPFEAKGDFERLVSGLAQAHRCWASGIFMLWHPVKDLRAASNYEHSLHDTGIPNILLAEIFIRERIKDGFNGCGLVIVNPPYTLEAELDALLPFLAQALAQGPGAAHRVVWIRSEDHH